MQERHPAPCAPHTTPRNASVILNEPARQQSVRRYGLADLPPLDAPDPELTALAMRARRLMRTQHAGVVILDGDSALVLAGSTGVPSQRLRRTDTVCHRVAGAFPGRRFFLTGD